MTRDRCEFCNYARAGKDQVVHCYRAPPTVTVIIMPTPDGNARVQQISMRPRIEADGWCGEFSERSRIQLPN